MSSESKSVRKLPKLRLGIKLVGSKGYRIVSIKHKNVSLADVQKYIFQHIYLKSPENKNANKNIYNYKLTIYQTTEDGSGMIPVARRVNSGHPIELCGLSFGGYYQFEFIPIHSDD